METVWGKQAVLERESLQQVEARRTDQNLRMESECPLLGLVMSGTWSLT